MRLGKALIMRSTSILLLVGTLLFAVALRGDAGVRVNTLPNAARPSLPQSTAAGRIAFAREGEIYLINPDGTGLTQLTPGESGVYNYQPALSPDGTRVAFGTVQDNISGISIVDVDGSGLRKLTTNEKSYDNEPAWSADGSKIAFVRGFDPTADGIANLTSCASAIYIVSVDSVDAKQINLTQGTDPAWSPDGTRIAFARQVDDNYDIYAITLEGGEVEQLTRTEAQEAEPVWSPDGSQIAYARDYIFAVLDCGFVHTGAGDPPLANGPDIYVMSADGSDQNRITNTENNFDPTWSPDGTSLAFVSFRDGFAEIYVVNTFQPTQVGITSDSIRKSSPSWSRADPRQPIDAN